jgi:hypothetical protein
VSSGSLVLISSSLEGSTASGRCRHHFYHQDERVVHETDKEHLCRESFESVLRIRIARFVSQYEPSVALLWVSWHVSSKRLQLSDLHSTSVQAASVNSKI